MITYDDVLIKPGKSLESRSEINLPNIIIPAPMSTVSGLELCKEQLKHQDAIAILHRFLPAEERLKAAQQNPELFIAVGVSDTEFELTKQLYDAGHLRFCIDVANGYSASVVRIVTLLKNRLPRPTATVIAGNVATVEGYRFLCNAKVDYIRCGIGGGSLCTTRLVTGVGVPQLSCIQEIYAEKLQRQREGNFAGQIIADGGIRNSGDMVKALVAGADYVMAGNIFAGCKEAPGDIITQNGIQYKKYSGMASLDANIDFYGEAQKCPEGVSTLTPIKGAYLSILENMLWGIRSGMSYCSATNLSELRRNAEFIYVTPSVVTENRPHGAKT